MDLVEYGDNDGQLVVYFHGAPGAMEEASVFAGAARAHKLRLVCIDRFSIDLSLDRESYYQELASQIRLLAGEGKVDIIAFSIGTHVALEVGARLGSQVRQMHLVSCAAPIDAGDFLNHMAGRLVFKLAMERPLIFSMLTQYQRLMAILSPQILVSMLFASATGEDKVLSKQRAFRRYITPVLKSCFAYRAKGYIRDIKYYVTWPGIVDVSATSVSIWHGTKDNWSPYSMASYLSKAIPGANGVEAMDGVSHYSCLHEAAPRICAQLEISENQGN